MDFRAGKGGGVMLTRAEQNIADLAPEGASVVVNGKLARGEMTPEMAAMLDLKARLAAMGDSLSKADAERITTEWRADYPGMWAPREEAA
jgi:hypothetical protein